MIKIKQGNSKQSGVYFPLCFSSRTKTIEFTESCKYDNNLSNPTNLQKIFGVALFHFFGSFKTTRTKKWWELHKWLSVRCGWRWSDELQCWELMDYCYINGNGDRLAYDKVKIRCVVGDRVTITTAIAPNKLILTIVKNNVKTLVVRDCKTPKLMLFFIRLRAYIEPKISTHDYTINTY